MASPVRSAHADHPRIPWQLPVGAVNRAPPLCAELRPWTHATGRDDPIGRGFRRRAGCIQLAGGQLSTLGGLAVVRRPRRSAAVEPRRGGWLSRTRLCSAASRLQSEAEGMFSLMFLDSLRPKNLASPHPGARNPSRFPSSCPNPFRQGPCRAPSALKDRAGRGGPIEARRLSRTDQQVGRSRSSDARDGYRTSLPVTWRMTTRCSGSPAAQAGDSVDACQTTPFTTRNAAVE